MDEQLEFVKLIASRLDEAGIDYMVTGSVAAAVYAAPRMTRDVDLVVECTPADVEKIVAAFEADCVISADAVREAVESATMFNIIHERWVIKADFIVRKDSPYRKLEFERRRRIVVDAMPIAFAAPEDLILSKLCWARDTGSAIQSRDVRELLAAEVDLDWRYLETWATTLGVERDLEHARQE
jgi:hypothetical protein